MGEHTICMDLLLTAVGRANKAERTLDLVRDFIEKAHLREPEGDYEEAVNHTAELLGEILATNA